jgi:hypothetical protein
VWNIVEQYLGKSGSYPPVSTANIPRFAEDNRFVINSLEGFRTRTENPRVGGSIPPLATIIQGISFGCSVRLFNISRFGPVAGLAASLALFVAGRGK